MFCGKHLSEVAGCAGGTFFSPQDFAGQSQPTLIEK